MSISTNITKKSWSGFVAGGLLLASARVGLAQEIQGQCSTHNFRNGFPCRTMQSNLHILSEQAASPISIARNQQVRNGEILSNTLWSNHFELVVDEDTGEKTWYLHPSGCSELNRIVRRQLNSPIVEVFVQADFNPNFRGTGKEMAILQDKNNLEHCRLVTDYVTHALRRDGLKVLIIDASPVGMESEEGLIAFKRGLRNFTSAIPERQLNRFDAGGAGSGN